MLKTLDIYNNSIPSSINKVGEVVSNIISNLQNSYGLIEESTLFELKVILNEMVLNAIKHGNREDESKFVKVTAGITENEFACFIVEDEGYGYDYECLCIDHAVVDAENDVSCIMESGRGILIVNSLCDKVRVNSKGNKIVVLKKLNRI